MLGIQVLCDDSLVSSEEAVALILYTLVVAVGLYILIRILLFLIHKISDKLPPSEIKKPKRKRKNK